MKGFLWGVVWPKAIKQHFSLQFPKVVDEIPPALVLGLTHRDFI